MEEEEGLEPTSSVAGDIYAPLLHGVSDGYVKSESTLIFIFNIIIRVW